MSFRILWHDGWPYPVTGHPFQYDVEEGHWFVQIRDGTWHQIVRRETGASLADAWDELEPAVRDWLAANVPREEHELPSKLVVEVALHPSAGGFEHERFVLARTVDTERGDLYVELTTVGPLPKLSQSHATRQTKNRDPALFNVTFRTTDHPLGVRLQFDATEFLETVVQRYLRRRPAEGP